MRMGPEGGVPILFVPPLLEEMNRTRALLAGIMRVLAAEGFRCTLPDLPGTGESERALETCDWADWQAAVQGADRPALVASFRGGALLDRVEAQAWWRFAPVSGASLLRDLERAGAAIPPGSSLGKSKGGGDHDVPAPLDFTRAERIWLAGYSLPEALASALREAEPAEVAPCRTVRLASDPKPADMKLDGPALWRRSEPGSSSDLTGAIASEISAWARSCGIC
jgi:pimeloyl-ACP methyl ester carboxylesterase